MLIKTGLAHKQDVKCVAIHSLVYLYIEIYIVYCILLCDNDYYVGPTFTYI